MASQPNFFLVGAPKCGTTALYQYLRSHPRIYMPAFKEPHYFARDLEAYRLIKTVSEYGRLFDAAQAGHSRIGEASVYYLRSSEAIPQIRAFDPEARIIAMLRNPVDMLHALHSQLLYVGEEREPDFERAWRLQGRRRRGRDIPARCREPLLLQFEELGRLGAQVERLLAVFPAAQVKLVLYEDFTAGPQTVYAEVLEFLGIPHDGSAAFPRINDNKRARSGWIKGALRKPPPVLRNAVRAWKGVVGGERVAQLKSRLVRLNTVREARPPLSAEFRAELVATFRNDVDRLSELLQRPLRWT
jgi:hypothetical protein